MKNEYPTNIPKWELEHSETAIRKRIDNSIPKALDENALRLAKWLQELRDKLNAHYSRDMYIIITSGFRCFALNSKLGGSKTSAHMLALAADIKVPGLSTRELALFIAEHMSDYDQVIDEFGRWVHVGLRTIFETPRGQLLEANKNSKGKTYYQELFIEGKKVAA